MYVCLFDIDGTLIDTAGAGEMAMLQVLSEDYGLDCITGSIPSAGRTDAAISTDLFAQHQLDLNTLDAFREAYLERLSNTLLEKDGRVLPGVRSIVEELADHQDVSLGLLTGNYEAAAWAKLEHYGLAEFFSFGAFGDSHRDRDDVARDALSRTHDVIGEVPPDRIWIIGDTPADIRCARSIGARVAAVATGIYSSSELHPHQPDVLFETMQDAEEFLQHFDD